MAIIGSIFETFKGSNNLELVTEFIEYYVVARGGIEPPTHGLSVRLSQYTQSSVVCYQLLLSIVLSIHYSVIEYCQLLSSVTVYRHLYGHHSWNDGHLYGHLNN